MQKGGKMTKGEMLREKSAGSGRRKKIRPVQPEIIRCKDCKHIQKWRSEESAKKFGQIYECAKNVLACPKPEDYCSYAERREG